MKYVYPIVGPSIYVILLQEHLLLAWPLFISLLILAFYLYPDDYLCIFMHYLFWLVILSPYLLWLYSLSFLVLAVLYLLIRSLQLATYAPFHSTGIYPIFPESLTTLLGYDAVTLCPYHIFSQ
jgi:hypothetical protein